MSSRPEDIYVREQDRMQARVLSLERENDTLRMRLAAVEDEIMKIKSNGKKKTKQT